MASPATQPTGGTIKFQTNIPERISLAFAEGREVSSQFGGDQVMYTLDDGRRMYVAPFVADKIRAAGIRAHQLFEITKAEVSHGNRRSVEFIVRPLEGGRSHPPAPETAFMPQHRQSSNADMTETLEQSIARVQAQRATTSVATPSPTIAQSLGSLFVECGREAIDAILKLEAYARERGLTDFAFGADAIERVAVHISIGAQQRSSR